jgi:hypothetical protein
MCLERTVARALRWLDVSLQDYSPMGSGKTVFRRPSGAKCPSGRSRLVEKFAVDETSPAADALGGIRFNRVTGPPGQGPGGRTLMHWLKRRNRCRGRYRYRIDRPCEGSFFLDSDTDPEPDPEHNPGPDPGHNPDAEPNPLP